ncbi:MAG: hypothetical protein QOJ68_1291 [Blastococcus sp.]|jgi:pyruvate,water dikinase|nr:hypothetical protein [Blastococcus sp.]
MTTMTTRRSPSAVTASEDTSPGESGMPSVLVERLSRLASADVDRAGGNGANPGEMVSAPSPFPRGDHLERPWH